MEVIKIIVEAYEQELFSFIGATSWPDLFECLISYAFVIFIAFVTLAIPLGFFFFTFLAPFFIK